MDSRALAPTMEPMVTKKKAGVGVVSEGGAHAVLRRGPARELSAEEEQVMRMRLGASPSRTAPLERSYQPLTDLEIEVRAVEIEAWMKMKARRAERSKADAEPEPAPARTMPTSSRAKEKIIRALRRK
jgi:hypothetical protein